MVHLHPNRATHGNPHAAALPSYNAVAELHLWWGAGGAIHRHELVRIENEDCCSLRIVLFHESEDAVRERAALPADYGDRSDRLGIARPRRLEEELHAFEGDLTAQKPEESLVEPITLSFTP